MSLDKYAIFIEPMGELRDAVIRWKNQLRGIFPHATYIEHPPHATLLFCHFKNIERVIFNLNRICDSVSYFEICSQQTQVFFDDASTGGGHTLAYKIFPSLNLMQLQQSCAESVESFVMHGNESLVSGLNIEPFQSSFRRFGFPFVGHHWIPHMTIASIKVKSDNAEMTSFQSQSFFFTQILDHISLWRVNGECHEKIQDFYFKET
jgi:2'-5' RNA ligase